MNNQEQYLASPEEEAAVRLEMREKCIGKFEKSEVGAFFAKSVGPALHAFAFLSDRATIDRDRFKINMNMRDHYHEWVLDGILYSGFSLGFRVTTKE